MKKNERVYNSFMLNTVSTLNALTSLDILLIVTTVVVACAGVFLIVILKRVAHIVSVADRFATTVEKFQDLFTVIERIPAEMIRKISDRLPRNK